ncbi:MAG: o-succinylbenzoate synthase [Candidatus Parcubacteria bacterium]|jgi:O-succinylbenzoate synthase
MKIQTIEILKLGLPMVHSFETSFGKLTHKETVIVRMKTDDGRVGYGESSAFFAPLYNYETVDTCVYIIKQFLAPLVVGKTFNSPAEFTASYKHIVGHHIAKTSLETAFWHLTAQIENKSMKQLVGGTQQKIAVGESIGIKATLEDTLSEISQRIDEGYRRIKVKIKPGWDLDIAHAIRNKWPTIDLMLDGNSAYNLHEHTDILKQMDQFNLTMLEQPLGEDDIIDHATLQKMIKTPVCLDESIISAEDARKALEIGACKIINIKPGRVGGVYESIKIHDLCKAAGIGVWCGGLLETGIGRAFNIALASKENYVYPADMSMYNLFYKEDLIEPSYVVDKEGYIAVPDTPGLGYTIAEDRIKTYTVDTIVIGA